MHKGRETVVDIVGGKRTAALIAKVRDGDMVAFTALYREHVGAVVKAVRDNVHDAETVADVTQEVFARVLERLGTLRDPDRFRPWLLSIARHAAIDQRRSRGRAPEPFDPAEHEWADTGRGPGEIAELNDLVRLVQGCVAGLSTRDATALTLVSQLGLSVAEVAVALGVSGGAAKVTLCRARRRLRDALALEYSYAEAPSIAPSWRPHLPATTTPAPRATCGTARFAPT